MLALVLISFAISYAASASRRTCNVYSVSDISQTDMWMDNGTIYGQVRADKIQTIYLSDTQQVTEVYVTQGQSVQVGDKLLAYDTSLSQLEVSRKELEIQQMREELTNAKKSYNSLAGSKVYTVAAKANETATLVKLNQPVVRAVEQEPTYRLTLLADEDEGVVVESYVCVQGDGTQEDPYLYLCANGIPYDSNFLREIGLLNEEAEEAQEDKMPVYVVFGISEGNKLSGDILQAGGMCFTVNDGVVSFIVFDASDYIGHPFGTPKPEQVCDHSYQATVKNPTCTEKGTITLTCAKCGKTETKDIAALGHSYSKGKCTRCQAVDPDYKENNGSSNNNNNNSSNNNNNSNNNSNNNNNNNSNNNNNTNNGSTNTGPSYAEIQAQKQTLQEKIKKLDLDIRMAEVELKRMQQELSDGIVYAEMAGTISEVLDADTAYQTKEPVIKLAGGGGYYVEGSVSELELDSVYIGQHVTLNSWESGDTYEGTVQSISDIPTENGNYYGSGNSNVSFYPFTVSVDGTANLREYETVDMTLEVEQEPTSGLYLEMPFILQENGRSYVYVTDEEGYLTKRYLTTGVTLWGSYVQVLDGLTQEDTIAFPYGKNAKEGAKTQLATLDELYGY